MIYRRFGRTGLQLSVFSCGGMRAMQSWSRGARVTDGSQANYEATVARALEVGINHIETARGYGTSEAQLGRTLKMHPRAAYFLQTKIRPSDDPKVFEAQLEESFRLLGVQSIDELRAALTDSPFRQQIPDLLREAHALLHNPDVSPLP